MKSIRHYSKIFLSEEDKSLSAKKLYGLMYLDMMSDFEKSPEVGIVDFIHAYNSLWGRVNIKVGKVLLKDGFVVALLSKFPDLRERLKSSGKFNNALFRRPKVASIPKITA